MDRVADSLKSNVSDLGEKYKVENKENRSDVRFTYRPTMPAHRSVKESPLSSAAIFKQLIEMKKKLNLQYQLSIQRQRTVEKRSVNPDEVQRLKAQKMTFSL